MNNDAGDVERQELLSEIQESIAEGERLEREYDALSPEERRFVDELLVLEAPSFEFDAKILYAVEDGSLAPEQADRLAQINGSQTLQRMRASVLRLREQKEAD
jgi:hypothetical protein